MKVTLLGTGTPGKDPNRFQSSALVEVSANIDGMHLRWTESLDKSLQAIELASLVDEPVFKIRGHFWAGNSLLCGLGDVAGARSQFSQMLTDAEQLRDRTWMMLAPWHNWGTPAKANITWNDNCKLYRQ